MHTDLVPTRRLNTYIVDFKEKCILIQWLPLSVTFIVGEVRYYVIAIPDHDIHLSYVIDAILILTLCSYNQGQRLNPLTEG